MAIPRQLPNAITIVRILCAPVFLWMLLADAGTDGPLRWWAAVLFIVAIATDGWRALADGVHFRAGAFAPGRQPDGNSLLLRGRTGWIAIDTGRHAAHAQAIADAARASGRPIVAIVNTHWHLDHVAGNVLLREAYPRAEVHASRRIERELHGFLDDYRRQLEALLRDRPDDAQAPDWRAELARSAAGPALLPTQPVTAPGERRVDGRTLVLGLVGDAVSGGDVWVLDRSTGTLAAGDLVTLPVPFLDTACPEGWTRALSALAALPFERLVPGHGEPMTRAGFERYRRAHARLHLVETVEHLIETGLGQTQSRGSP